jgi:hypothetical protein
MHQAPMYADTLSFAIAREHIISKIGLGSVNRRHTFSSCVKVALRFSQKASFFHTSTKSAQQVFNVPSDRVVNFAVIRGSGVLGRSAAPREFRDGCESLRRARNANFYAEISWRRFRKQNLRSLARPWKRVINSAAGDFFGEFIRRDGFALNKTLC